jgi:zinc-ribbon domain
VPPPICPNCGAVVPADAKVCPACGADENMGWDEEAYGPNPDLPDEEFDYEDFKKREFGSRSPVPHGIPIFWWIVAIVALIAFLFLWLR